ncbi:MAG: TonB-dependent receptor [Proteobacteria bacterium]|nr:TonB-dependent receptor [Pseudomonadota bacterium]
MSRTIKCWNLVVVYALSMFFGVLPFATAQPQEATLSSDSDDELVIEEIVVTAQKREQNLNDVGITVHVFSAQDIKDNRILVSQDIAANTSNLTVVNQFGTSLPLYYMRGVGLNDFSSNNTSTVGIYVDGVFQTSPAMHGFQLFDLERVEVLKGPQGTLYGRNTTGGAINFIAAKPTDTPNGYLKVDFGTYQEGRVEAAYGNAISENLTGRVAFSYEFGDGYVKNRVTGNDLQARNKGVARVLLEWTPTDQTSVLFNVHGGVDRSDAGVYHQQGLLDPAGLAPLPPILLPQCGPLVAGESFDFRATPGQCVDPFGYFDADNDLYAGAFDFEPVQEDDFIGASVTVDWGINDNYDFVSISAFESYDRYADGDLDSSPLPILHTSFTDSVKQFTQEFRLNYNGDRSHWVTGLYYSHDRIESTNQDVCLDDNPGAVFPIFCVAGDFRQDLQQTTNITALFLHTEYLLGDTWNLTLGGRYSYEDKDFNLELNAQDFFLLISGGAFAGPVLSPVDNASFNSFSWKIGLDKKVSEDVLLYGLVSKGFKTGGFSGAFSFGGPDQLLPFGDESILAYEIGFKSTSLDNRLSFNGAAFYYDYQDIQLFAFFTSAAGASIQVLSNAGNADILGVEAEIVYLPTDALALSANVGWLDHELKDFQVDPTQPPVPGIPGPADANGNKLANTPDVNFTGAVKYEWNLDKGNIALRANFQYQSGIFLETFNQPFLSEDGYWLVDASLTYTLGDGTYEFGIWGQNLFEEERMVFGIPFQFSGFNSIGANQPRRYGVSVRYNFGK